VVRALPSTTLVPALGMSGGRQSSKSSGGTSRGFAGFAAVAKDFGFSTPLDALDGREPISVLASAKAAASPVYGGPDGELSVIAQHMAKKTESTKVKALASLVSLAGSEDKPKDLLKELLPVFAHHYPMLALHPSRHIREGAHKAWGALLGRVKRASAKLLPLLLPPCLAGMHDPAREVAKAASDAIGAVFPDEKRIEAIMHCSQAAVRLWGERLLQSPAEIAGEMLLGEEEAEDTMIRARSTSFRALAGVLLVCQDAGERHRDAAERALREMWEDASDEMLQLVVSSRAPSVRASGAVWLEAMSRLPVETGLRLKCVTTAIAALGESDPVALVPVWSAATSVLRNLALLCLEEGEATVDELNLAVAAKLPPALKKGLFGELSVMQGHVTAFLSAFPPAMLLVGTSVEEDLAASSSSSAAASKGKHHSKGKKMKGPVPSVALSVIKPLWSCLCSSSADAAACVAVLADVCLVVAARATAADDSSAPSMLRVGSADREAALTIVQTCGQAMIEGVFEGLVPADMTTAPSEPTVTVPAILGSESCLVATLKVTAQLLRICKSRGTSAGSPSPFLLEHALGPLRALESVLHKYVVSLDAPGEDLPAFPPTALRLLPRAWQLSRSLVAEYEFAELEECFRAMHRTTIELLRRAIRYLGVSAALLGDWVRFFDEVNLTREDAFGLQLVQVLFEQLTTVLAIASPAADRLLLCATQLLLSGGSDEELSTVVKASRALDVAMGVAPDTTSLFCIVVPALCEASHESIRAVVDGALGSITAILEAGYESSTIQSRVIDASKRLCSASEASECLLRLCSDALAVVGARVGDAWSVRLLQQVVVPGVSTLRSTALVEMDPLVRKLEGLAESIWRARLEQRCATPPLCLPTSSEALRSQLEQSLASVLSCLDPSAHVSILASVAPSIALEQLALASKAMQQALESIPIEALASGSLEDLVDHGEGGPEACVRRALEHAERCVWSLEPLTVVPESVAHLLVTCDTMPPEELSMADMASLHAVWALQFLLWGPRGGKVHLVKAFHVLAEFLTVQDASIRARANLGLAARAGADGEIDDLALSVTPLKLCGDRLVWMSAHSEDLGGSSSSFSPLLMLSLSSAPVLSTQIIAGTIRWLRSERDIDREAQSSALVAQASLAVELYPTPLLVMVAQWVTCHMVWHDVASREDGLAATLQHLLGETGACALDGVALRAVSSLPHAAWSLLVLLDAAIQQQGSAVRRELWSHATVAGDAHTATAMFSFSNLNPGVVPTAAPSCSHPTLRALHVTALLADALEASAPLDALVSVCAAAFRDCVQGSVGPVGDVEASLPPSLPLGVLTRHGRLVVAMQLAGEITRVDSVSPAIVACLLRAATDAIAATVHAAEDADAAAPMPKWAEALILHHSSLTLHRVMTRGLLTESLVGVAFVDLQCERDRADKALPSDLSKWTPSFAARLEALRYLSSVLLVGIEMATTDTTVSRLVPCLLRASEEIGLLGAQAREDWSNKAEEAASVVSEVSSRRKRSRRKGPRMPACFSGSGIVPTALILAAEAVAPVMEAAFSDHIVLSDKASLVGSRHEGSAPSEGEVATPTPDSEDLWREAEALVATVLSPQADALDEASEAGSTDWFSPSESTLCERMRREVLCGSRRREQVVLMAWLSLVTVVKSSKVSTVLSEEITEWISKSLPLDDAFTLAASCCRTLERADAVRLKPSEVEQVPSLLAATWSFSLAAPGPMEEGFGWTIGEPFLPANLSTAPLHMSWPCCGQGSEEMLQLLGEVEAGLVEHPSESDEWLRSEHPWHALDCAVGDATYGCREPLTDPLAGHVGCASSRKAVWDPFGTRGEGVPAGDLAGALTGADEATCPVPVCVPPWAMANELLFRLCQVLPTKVASWVGTLRRGGYRAQVSDHIAIDASPRLLGEQFQALLAEIRKEGWTSGPFVVRVVPATRSFTAIYEQDDATLSMTVSVPRNFPLQKLKISCDSRTASAWAAKWRRWEVQMLALLTTQRGSFADAVRMWKDNMDKEFEGVEPCPVCYSVIAIGDKSLPRLSCPVCRNKFHSSCLFRWFQSSGNSKCPMCRADFH
jgi:hypothetical protein